MGEDFNRKIDDKVNNYCNTCQQLTNHLVVGVYHKAGSFEYQVDKYYMLVKCAGCDSISYKTEIQDWETRYQEENGDEVPTIDIITYPPALKAPLLDNLYMLPVPVREIYKEASECHENGNLRLAGAGYRGVIEAICANKEIKGTELKSQISGLLKNGWITKNESARLHSVRFLGNHLLHNLLKPDLNSLYIVRKIINHLLDQIYIIDGEMLGNPNLQTVVKSYDEFEKLLLSELSKMPLNTQKTIIGFMNNQKSKVPDDFDNYEKLLSDRISSSKFKFLSKTEVLRNKRIVYSLCSVPDVMDFLF